MALSWVGAGAFTAGTGAITVPVPAGLAADDLMLLAVETANQAITTPSGWTHVFTSSYTGTLVGIYRKFAGSSEGSVSIADTGDHQVAAIIAVRGVPLDYAIHAVNQYVVSLATQTIYFNDMTAPFTGSWLVGFVGLTADTSSSGASTISASTPYNRVQSVSKRVDQSSNVGNGGGLVIATGSWNGTDLGIDHFNGASSNGVDAPRCTISLVLSPQAVAAGPAAVLEAFVKASAVSGKVDTWSGVTKLGAAAG